MIAIIANPNALRFNIKQVYRIKYYLETNGQYVDLFFTQNAKDGEIITRKIKNYYDIIAAYGGDGIVNEIINGLAFSNAALAVLPAGTTSVLALELNIPKDAFDASKLLLNPKIEFVPLGSVNNHKFILMAGIGFDAESIYYVNEKLKKLTGKLAYIVAGFKALFRYEYSDITIETDGKIIKSKWIVITNIKKYAGNFVVSKNINIRDEKFDVCVSKWDIKLLEPFFVVFGVVIGSHKLIGNIKHLLTDKDIVIKTQNAPIQVDGDFLGRISGRIKLLKKALKIVMPK